MVSFGATSPAPYRARRLEGKGWSRREGTRRPRRHRRSPAEEESDPDELPEWQRELIESARAVCADEGRYLTLPDKFEVHEYRFLERFAWSYPNRAISEEALRCHPRQRGFRVSGPPPGGSASRPSRTSTGSRWPGTGARLKGSRTGSLGAERGAPSPGLPSPQEILSHFTPAGRRRRTASGLDVLPLGTEPGLSFLRASLALKRGEAYTCVKQSK